MSLPQITRNRLLLIIFLILLLVSAVVMWWWYFIQLPRLGVRIRTTGSLKPPTYLNFNSALEQSLKQTFADPKYSAITTYLSLASAERKDLGLKYDYLSRAYNRMLEAYNQTKNAKMKEQINFFRYYLKGFPQFKDADLPVLK